MKRIGVQARDRMIEHVREQMKGRIVEVIRTREDLPDVFPRGALDPYVAHHVLRIVNSEKPEAKVTRVKNGGRQDAQAHDGGI